MGLLPQPYYSKQIGEIHMQNNINKSVSATDKDILLKMVDIEKTFPGVKALDHAQLTVKKEQFMHLWAKTAPVNQHL